MSNNNEGLPTYWSGRRTESGLKKEYQKTVELKNGSQIDLEEALTHLGALRSALNDLSSHFSTLLSMARGESQGTDTESVAVLRYYGFVSLDGTVLPGLRDVLLSAFIVKPEGYFLNNPFKDIDGKEVERLTLLKKTDFVTKVKKRIEQNQGGRSHD